MKKAILFFAFLAITGSSLFAQQTTGDLWIKKIYNDTWGRDPVGIEWNIYNYKNGAWKNYTELMNAIYDWRKSMNTTGISFKYSAQTINTNKVLIGVFQNGTQIGVSLISNDGASIVASGGGNIISTNGAGIVASGGGNIVASGGGNIVASGGGNISIYPLTKGLYIAASLPPRQVQAVGTIVIPTSNGGAMIIK
jgi:hypothetical protein